METVTVALRHWLSKNNIPTDGVRITIQFPEQRYANAAEACIKRDLQPMMQFAASDTGKIKTMNGIGVSLTYDRPRPHAH